MSISRKISDAAVNRGLTSQVIKEGEVVESQSWEGSLEQMQAVFDAEQYEWQVIRASRNGPNWQLTAERTLIAEENAPHPRQNEETIEVIWREVMLPLEQAPGLLQGIADESLSLGIIQQIKQDVAAGQPPITYDDPRYEEYQRLLILGRTEFPGAVPVVRRTFTYQNRIMNRLALGQAYVRDTPPIDVPGDWEWLKTADERRRVGATYTQVEEWTGGLELSTLLYPTE